MSQRTLAFTVLAIVLAWAAIVWASDCWTVPIREVVRVIDGDTIDVRVAVWLGFEAEAIVVPERVRLLGVDTPERKGVTRAAGDAAKAFTEAWIAHPDRRDRLTLWTCRRDAFGRILGGISADGDSLSAALVRAGHGR